MNYDEVKAKVRAGVLIECTAEEYSLNIRRYLQQFAGESIDNAQDIYSMIALNEVSRLDKKFEPPVPMQTCGNCGVPRFVHNNILEACPNCGDDETDLALIEDHP